MVVMMVVVVWCDVVVVWCCDGGEV